MIVKITVDYWHINLPHTHIYSFKYNPDNDKEELTKEFKRILEEYDEVSYISFNCREDNFLMNSIIERNIEAYKKLKDL